MLGLISFNNLELKWSDPIPWRDLGVFTADRPHFTVTMILYFMMSCTFHYSLYKFCEWFLEKHGRLVFNEHSEFFKLPQKVKREYYSRIISDVHAIISVIISVNAAYFSC